MSEEKKRSRAEEFFYKYMPKDSDSFLSDVFDKLNEKVFNSELPKIVIAWSPKQLAEECASLMGGYFFNPDKMNIKDNYILVNPDTVDRQIEETVCHEMVHFKTHIIDYQNGVEFFSENSCCPFGKNGGHNDMFVTIGDEIHRKFGYRIDQFYTDTMKSKLKNAGEENYKDDGEEYDYTFYKVNGSIICQKIEPDAKYMDNFPVFHGRIEELNDVPLTKGNPFDDKNFGDKEFLNVYTRPLDKWTKERYDFIDLGTTYHTANEAVVETLLVMEK